MLDATYPYYLANRPRRSGALLEVRDKYSGEVATRDYLRRELEELRELIEGLQSEKPTGGKQESSDRRVKKQV